MRFAVPMIKIKAVHSKPFIRRKAASTQNREELKSKTNKKAFRSKILTFDW